MAKVVVKNRAKVRKEIERISRQRFGNNRQLQRSRGSDKAVAERVATFQSNVADYDNRIAEYDQKIKEATERRQSYAPGGRNFQGQDDWRSRRGKLDAQIEKLAQERGVLRRQRSQEVKNLNRAKQGGRRNVTRTPDNRISIEQARQRWVETQYQQYERRLTSQVRPDVQTVEVLDDGQITQSAPIKTRQPANIRYGPRREFVQNRTSAIAQGSVVVQPQENMVDRRARRVQQRGKRLDLKTQERRQAFNYEFLNPVEGDSKLARTGKAFGNIAAAFTIESDLTAARVVQAGDKAVLQVQARTTGRREQREQARFFRRGPQADAFFGSFSAVDRAGFNPEGFVGQLTAASFAGLGVAGQRAVTRNRLPVVREGTISRTTYQTGTTTAQTSMATRVAGGRQVSLSFGRVSTNLGEAQFREVAVGSARYGTYKFKGGRTIQYDIINGKRADLRIFETSGKVRKRTQRVDIDTPTIKPDRVFYGEQTTQLYQLTPNRAQRFGVGITAETYDVVVSRSGRKESFIQGARKSRTLVIREVEASNVNFYTDYGLIGKANGKFFGVRTGGEFSTRPPKFTTQSIRQESQMSLIIEGNRFARTISTPPKVRTRDITFTITYERYRMGQRTAPRPKKTFPADRRLGKRAQKSSFDFDTRVGVGEFKSTLFSEPLRILRAPRSRQSFRLATTQRNFQLSASTNLFGERQTPRDTPEIIQTTTPRRITRQVSIQRLSFYRPSQSLLSTTSQGSSVFAPPRPPRRSRRGRPPTVRSPFFGGIPSLGGRGGAKRRGKRSRRLRYTPSLVAELGVFKGRRGRAITGLEIRGL